MAEPFSLQPSTILGDRYVIRELISRGQWSLTLRANSLSDRQPVILKLPRQNSQGIQFQAVWMQRVVQGLASLHHPNRARILDYFETQGLPVLVQQEVIGIPLSQRLHQKPLTEAQAIAVIRQVAIALTGIHGQGLIHRDLKPENIIYRTGINRPVLVDWGLQPSLFPANRASSYAAPEQFQPGGPFNPGLDVYGLAATLYALVTGQPPVHAALRAQSALIMPRQIQPRLSAVLERAILQGMEPDPQVRPPSMGAWLSLLPEAVATPAPAAVPQAVSQPVSRPTPITVTQAVQTQPVQVKPVQEPVQVQSVKPRSPSPSGVSRPTLPTPNFNPMKTLIGIGCIAATLGAFGGTILRISNPASVAGLSGLGRPQSFPEESWPGSSSAETLPQDVPPPEQQLEGWQNALPEEGALREVIPDDATEPPLRAVPREPEPQILQDSTHDSVSPDPGEFVAPEEPAAIAPEPAPVPEAFIPAPEPEPTVVEPSPVEQPLESLPEPELQAPEPPPLLPNEGLPLETTPESF